VCGAVAVLLNDTAGCVRVEINDVAFVSLGLPPVSQQKSRGLKPLRLPAVQPSSNAIRKKIVTAHIPANRMLRLSENSAVGKGHVITHHNRAIGAILRTNRRQSARLHDVSIVLTFLNDKKMFSFLVYR
jgi:hypothetical protein